MPNNAWDHTDQTRCPLRLIMWFLHYLVLRPIGDTCFSFEASKVSVTRMGSVGSSYSPLRDPDLTTWHWLSCFLFRLPSLCPTTACWVWKKCSSGRCVPSPSPPSLWYAQSSEKEFGHWLDKELLTTPWWGGGNVSPLRYAWKQMKTKGKSKGTVSQQARECSLGGCQPLLSWCTVC